MKHIPNREAKMAYLVEHQYGYCPIAKSEGWYEPVSELHHKVADSNVNCKLYPLLIHSLWNLVAVNHWWHGMHPHRFRMRYLEADKREAFLQRHPMIAKRLNMVEEE